MFTIQTTTTFEKQSYDSLSIMDWQLSSPFPVRFCSLTAIYTFWSYQLVRFEVNGLVWKNYGGLS